MPIGQLQYPEWIGKGEPAGAPLLRGAQAGAAIAGSFTQAYNANQNRKLQERQLNIQEEHAKLQRMQVGAELYMQSKTQRDQQEGEVEWAQWNAQYGEDPVAMMDAPMPKTDYASKRAAGAKVAASQTTTALQYANDIKEWHTRLNQLDPIGRAKFTGDNAAKGIPTEQQWKQLDEAMESTKDRALKRATSMFNAAPQTGTRFLTAVDKDGNVSYRESPITDPRTATKKNLDDANKLDAQAKNMRDLGYNDAADNLERDAALLRSGVEGGPSSHEGFLMRNISTLRADIAALRSKVASGGMQMYMKNGVPRKYSDDLSEAVAQLGQMERELEATSGKRGGSDVSTQPTPPEATLWDEFNKVNE